MLPLPGTPLPLSPLTSARWTRDLVNLGGPLLSEFRNQADEPILLSWCDRDEEVNRWLAFRVRERELIKLIMRRTDLHSLVASPSDGFLYIIDIDDQFYHRACSVTEPRELPPDYMPDPGSFLPADKHGAGRGTYAVLLDGDWDAEEIADFTAKFQQTYLALHVYGRQREARRAEHNYPWKGGFSAVNFYKALRAQVSSGVRPQLDAFVYSSPGYAKWQVDWATADAVRVAVARFRDNRNAIMDIANAAYATIREWGLNDRNVEAPPAGGEHDRYLGFLFDRLAEVLGSVDADLVKATHGGNFVCLKIVLSIYTRLNFLYSLSARGMAEF